MRKSRRAQKRLRLHKRPRQPRIMHNGEDRFPVSERCAVLTKQHSAHFFTGVRANIFRFPVCPDFYTQPMKQTPGVGRLGAAFPVFGQPIPERSYLGNETRSRYCSPRDCDSGSPSCDLRHSLQHEAQKVQLKITMRSRANARQRSTRCDQRRPSRRRAECTYMVRVQCRTSGLRSLHNPSSDRQNRTCVGGS